MTLSELFQTLKTLSKADLNSVKQFLESLDFNYNGFEDFLLSKKSENGISCLHCGSFNIKKNGHKGLMQRFCARTATRLLLPETILSHFLLKSHLLLGKNTLNV